VGVEVALQHVGEHDHVVVDEEDDGPERLREPPVPGRSHPLVLLADDSAG
jgi:hypothetical protein